MHTFDPITKGVQDKSNDMGIGEVETVAATCIIHVIAIRFCRGSGQTVVGCIINALEG
jgi:hypothetical protein